MKDNFSSEDLSFSTDNVFSKDIDVPLIVQKKAEEAFLTIKAERNGMVTHMTNQNSYTETQKQHTDIQGAHMNTNHAHRFTAKKTAAGLLAAAACAAVILSSGPLSGMLKGSAHFGTAGSSNTEAKDSLLSAINQVDKMFTLQVKAAESSGGQMMQLKNGHPVPTIINDDNSSSWVFGADPDGTVSYCINIPQLTCVGEQIKSITYSINNGAFQIVQPENEDSIIIDGQLYDGELDAGNTGSIGGDYSDTDGQPSRPFETVYYKSFTLDYNKQSDNYTWINICNELYDRSDLKQLLWDSNGREKEFNEGTQKMLDGTIITCTVNYTDNTSQSADIRVDSCLMTKKEAGEKLDPGMKPEELDEETTVITFELLQ